MSRPLFFDLFFKLFVMLGNGHINDAVSQVDVADQQGTMEIGAEDIFIAGALGFVFSIVAHAFFDFSERTHVFAKEGASVMIFESFVGLVEFFAADGDVADEPVIVLAQGIMVERADAGYFIAGRIHVIVSQ